MSNAEKALAKRREMHPTGHSCFGCFHSFVTGYFVILYWAWHREVALANSTAGFYSNRVHMEM